jgi:hypothetical protein
MTFCPMWGVTPIVAGKRGRRFAVRDSADSLSELREVVRSSPDAVLLLVPAAS